jgi:hypothetical protein
MKQLAGVFISLYIAGLEIKIHQPGFKMTRAATIKKLGRLLVQIYFTP